MSSAWISSFSSIVPIVLGAVSGWLVSELKAKKDRREIFERQRLQVRLAVKDLLSSMERIQAREHGLQFLEEDLVYDQPPRPKRWERRDRYYLKYDLVDTVYRLCALLGWMEIYRNDATFLLGSKAERQQLEEGFEKLRNALAEERPLEGMNADPPDQKCAFILEDDQRAIGEQMFGAERPAMVIGYAAFCEQLFRLPRREEAGGSYSTSQNHWIWNATLFVLDLRCMEPKSMPPNNSGHELCDPRLVRLRNIVEVLRQMTTSLGHDRSPG